MSYIKYAHFVIIFYALGSGTSKVCSLNQSRSSVAPNA